MPPTTAKTGQVGTASNHRSTPLQTARQPRTRIERKQLQLQSPQDKFEAGQGVAPRNSDLWRLNGLTNRLASHRPEHACLLRLDKLLGQGLNPRAPPQRVEREGQPEHRATLSNGSRLPRASAEMLLPEATSHEATDGDGRLQISPQAGKERVPGEHKVCEGRRIPSKTLHVSDRPTTMNCGIMGRTGVQ